MSWQRVQWVAQNSAQRAAAAILDIMGGVPPNREEH